jgi:regulator of cell morphogenesis and NO signaling
MITAQESTQALASDRRASPATDWNAAPLAQLIQHILTAYHEPLKAEVPRLVQLARRVEREHADQPGCPVGLAALLTDVHEAVESHLAKEERILFPLILHGRGPTAHMPVQVMTQEHEDHEQSLRHIRELTSDLRIPDHACASWRDLYGSLARLETELLEHIQLENTVLFPRALND